ncbi:hypothetical protein F4678DRAFT_240987 [Xylaria arbuscula]|nr:hypothetical protein F4678DRAFT_240987 [Xylaria arbuscula]
MPILPLLNPGVDGYSDPGIDGLLNSFDTKNLSGPEALRISAFEFSKSNLSKFRCFDTRDARSNAVSSWAKGRFMLATPSIRLLFVFTPDDYTAKGENAHVRRQLHQIRDELKPAMQSLGFLEHPLEIFNIVVLDAIPVKSTETERAAHQDPNVVYHIGSLNFSLTYRYDPDSKTHTGIVLGENNQQLFSRLVHNIVAYRDHVGHPHILPIAAQRALSTEFSSWLENQKGTIIEAQVETGYHHKMTSPLQTRTLMDYSELSVKMISAAINIATTQLCFKILADHGHFLMNEVPMENHEISTPSASSTAFLQYEVCRFRRDIQIFLLEAEYLERKATILVQGIFNLIAQQDQNTSIGIARDSRILAAESKRDSTSMKTLAVVTMAFLPGAFVAAILAIPVFHWDATDPSNIMDHRFWIYWSITIPLTLGTFLAWFVWIKYVPHEKDDSQWVRSEVTAPKSP